VHANVKLPLIWTGRPQAQATLTASAADSMAVGDVTLLYVSGCSWLTLEDSSLEASFRRFVARAALLSKRAN
jgi:hypothetical protein